MIPWNSNHLSFLPNLFQKSEIQNRCFQVVDKQTLISVENKKNLGSAFDMKIKLLQEELDKLQKMKLVKPYGNYENFSTAFAL